jgi:hypothetical protein
MSAAASLQATSNTEFGTLVQKLPSGELHQLGILEADHGVAHDPEVL